MSVANKSAINRRANKFETTPKIGGYNPSISAQQRIQPSSQSQFQQTQQQQPQPGIPQGPPGLTLQQVIAVIDKRLINLEKNVNQINERQDEMEKQTQQTPYQEMQMPEQQIASNQLNDILEEYNSRFELLTEEINELKNVVMKLQSYTMDVNRMLIEERTTKQEEDKNTIHYNISLQQQQQDIETQTDSEKITSIELNNNEELFTVSASAINDN